MDEELLFLNNLKPNFSGPYVRNLYLKKATEEFNLGNIKQSIWYQNKALCITVNSTYFNESTNDWSEIHNQQKNITSNKISLIEFAKTYVKNGFEPKDNKLIKKEIADDFFDVLNQFPKEWTIIQLCKGYNSNSTHSLENEYMSEVAPIYFSILKHVRREHFPEPICFKIDLQKSNNIFEKFLKMANDVKQKYSFEKEDNKSNRAKYWEELKVLREDVAKVLEDFKDVIGSLIYFLSGQCHEEYRKIEAGLFSYVDKFCHKNGLGERENIFISTIVRQRHLLKNDDIKRCAEDICKLEQYPQSMCNSIFEFIFNIESTESEQLKFYPCILIVDELIDFLFWEILMPKQEICRISSFHILKTLYFKYKNQISNGYLKITVKNGNCLLNTDKTLPLMEKRMSSFFQHWVPHWNCIAGSAPSAEEAVSLLTNADVYVYCGHGSGLQFYNGHRITKLVTSSIAFLFGCESIRLKSDGLHSEMYGSHLYYHAALCPAVIGCLLLALDLQLDNMSVALFQLWIPSAQKDLWSFTSKSKENLKVQIIKETHQKRLYEPRLPLVLVKLRENLADFHIKPYFVYRGLPIWNTTAE